MKKLILLAFIAAIFVSCIDALVDPLDFKGCVVDNKVEFMDNTKLVIKLTNDSLKQIYGHSYISILVSKREYQLYNIGDTIK